MPKDIHGKPIFVGSTVIVDISGRCPTHGWGNIRNGDIGVVHEIFNRMSDSRSHGPCILVDFPHQKEWHAHGFELIVAGLDLCTRYNQRIMRKE